MVVQIVNVEYVTVGKEEDYSPVCADRYRPKSFPLAFKRMQPEAGQIHIGCGVRRVKAYKNVTQLNDVLSDHSARVGVFIKSLQSSVADRTDHLVP
jgi:hypothetical protein